MNGVEEERNENTKHYRSVWLLINTNKSSVKLHWRLFAIVITLLGISCTRIVIHMLKNDLYLISGFEFSMRFHDVTWTLNVMLNRILYTFYLTDIYMRAQIGSLFTQCTCLQDMKTKYKAKNWNENATKRNRTSMITASWNVIRFSIQKRSYKIFFSSSNWMANSMTHKSFTLTEVKKMTWSECRQQQENTRTWTRMRFSFLTEVPYLC